MSKSNNDPGSPPEADIDSGLDPSFLPDAPPSYTEATIDSPYTSHLSAHLSSLSSAVRSRNSTHQAHQAAFDADLLSLLTPEIDSLLSSISDPSLLPSSHRSGRIPRAAQLTLVPSAAVPSDWHPTDTDHPDDELHRLVRVHDPKGILSSSGSKKSDSGYDEYSSAASSSSSAGRDKEFDEWGRWDHDSPSSSDPKPGEWWWRDEETATRLARHLQPRNLPLPARDRERLFSRNVGGGGAAGPSTLPPRSDAAGGSSSSAYGSAASTREDDVGMTVKAEEVSFRRENEMGIWESLSGWGIVVRVRIRR